MNKIKCPKCEVNCISEGEEMCDVCANKVSRSAYNKNSLNSVAEYNNAMNKARSSASPWFFKKYLEEIENNYDDFVLDLARKQAFIEKVFNIEKRDSSINGTVTRVNSVIRYIRLKRELISFVQKFSVDI